MSRLTLSVADPATAPQAVVRDWKLRVVGHFAVGEPAELAPGRYLVSLPSPGGEEDVRAVELTAGQEATVVFEAPVAAGLESLAIAPELPWHARLLSGRDGAPVEGSLTAAGAGEAVELTADAPAGTTWVQVAAPGGVARNAMLPGGWRLRLGLAEADVSATAVPPPGGMVAALAAYLAGGQLRAAADLGAEALRGEVADPIGAALGGYALLRMARAAPTHDLAGSFEWLPDGAVIAAELALLDGRRDDAAAQLVRAAERGVPLFADGLSLLGRRVREGLVDTEPARRLAALTPFMELGQLTVALPGRDPFDPATTQAPLRAFPADDGWRSFVGAEEG
jgi:hypothetical protein